MNFIKKRTDYSFQIYPKYIKYYSRKYIVDNIDFLSYNKNKDGKKNTGLFTQLSTTKE